MSKKVTVNQIVAQVAEYEPGMEAVKPSRQYKRRGKKVKSTFAPEAKIISRESVLRSVDIAIAEERSGKKIMALREQYRDTLAEYTKLKDAKKDGAANGKRNRLQFLKAELTKERARAKIAQQQAVDHHTLRLAGWIAKPEMYSSKVGTKAAA